MKPPFSFWSTPYYVLKWLALTVAIVSIQFVIDTYALFGLHPKE